MNKKKEIRIEKYDDSMRNDWENFVDNSNNGVMFHKQAFLDYHEPDKFDFYHLTFWEGDKLIALLPGGVKENGEVFWSPVGASYGSIVAGDLPFEKALSIVDKFMEYSKTRFREVFLIPPPLIYYKNYNQHLEYSMLYRKFDFELHYISHAIDLKHGDDTLKYFDKTARKTVRKILRERKIEIRESDDYASFNKILVENKSRHNVKPTHSLEDMLRLRGLLPNNLRLTLVYYNNKPIAGGLLFLCNEKVSLCFYNMLLYEYEWLKPVYLINYDAVRYSVEKGCEWVDIGVSQDTSADDPMTPAKSLIFFKERFFARGILRSTYHYKFNDKLFY